jgi:hypothetical protein
MRLIGVTPVVGVLADIVEGAHAGEWYFGKSSRIL